MSSPFALGPEQSDIQQSIRRLFSAVVTSEYLHRKIPFVSPDPELRARCVELGLFEYFSSDDPCIAPSLTDLALVAEECGRVLFPEPLAEQLLCGPFLFSQLLTSNGRDAAQRALGPESYAALNQGTARVALVPVFNSAGRDKKQKFGKGAEPSISGKFELVPAVSETAALLIAKGSELYLVPLTPGGAYQSQPASTLDLTIARADFELKGCSSVRLDCESFRDALSVAAAAELSGMSERAVEMTVEYVKTRKQFGRAIGSFQAVQHRLADMYRESASLRALTRFAAWAFTHSPQQSALASRAALHFAITQVPGVIEGAIQLHGGIGFTWEFDLHLFLRRARSVEALYRDEPDRTDLLLAAAT